MKTDEELAAFFTSLNGYDLVTAYRKISDLFSDLYKELRDVTLAQGLRNEKNLTASLARRVHS